MNIDTKQVRDMIIESEKDYDYSARKLVKDLIAKLTEYEEKEDKKQVAEREETHCPECGSEYHNGHRYHTEDCSKVDPRMVFMIK